MSNAPKAAIAAAVLVLTSGTGLLAGPEHIQIIGEQCGIQLGLSAAVCNCVADSAASQLTDLQQAFTAAQVANDQAEIIPLQPTMTVGDMTTVGTFMGAIVGQCGG